jgi:hypothetical protein
MVSSRVYVKPSATSEACAGVPAHIAIAPKLAAIHEDLKPIDFARAVLEIADTSSLTIPTQGIDRMTVM